MDVKDKTDVTAASSKNLKADAITFDEKSFIADFLTALIHFIRGI